MTGRRITESLEVRAFANKLTIILLKSVQFGGSVLGTGALIQGLRCALPRLGVLGEASITYTLSFAGSGVRLGTHGTIGKWDCLAPPRLLSGDPTTDHFPVPVSPVGGETRLDLGRACCLYPPAASADSSWPGRGGQGVSFSLGIEKESTRLTHLCAHPPLHP